MSEDQNPVLLTDAPDETPKPARRKAPARASRKKADPAEPAAVEAVPATPKPKRAPRKPKAKPAEAVPAPETVASPVVSEEAAPAVVASAEAVLPASRRKRKRRRGRTERAGSAGPAAAETTSLDETPPAAPALAEVEPDATAAPAAEPVAAPAELVEAAEESAEPAPLAPLTVVSLGLDTPPALSAEALAVLKGAQIVLGSADALDRLAALGLALPQALCAPESVHLDLRRIGHVGSVLVVVGDAAGDGPAAELLAELGPGQVRVLPGVGRVQAACAALGLSPDVVSVVDLRRSPLAALRGQLRAHRLFAVPLADAAAPVAVARLLVDSGFAGARVWVCEFAGGELQARAWLATELAELRESFEPRAVLIVATGPSAGLFAELPGIAPESLGDAAHAALPLAARLLALAWLQPAAWETGWAISDGEASLALEWARAVPTARLRAVGVDPSLLGVVMARAGVGENLAAIPAASPLRCREWPAPEAVFVRGGVGLSEWLAAAWARLAPGGRLVATAEDDNARADLLAFAAEVPAEAWQELALASGETVAGRLRFAPAAPVRLALWRKPLET